jgi:hypothetical protein
MFEVFFPCMALYFDIINKDLQELVHPILEYFCHGSGKQPVPFFSSNDITFQS